MMMTAVHALSAKSELPPIVRVGWALLVVGRLTLLLGSALALVERLTLLLGSALALVEESPFVSRWPPHLSTLALVRACMPPGRPPPLPTRRPPNLAGSTGELASLWESMARRS